MGGRAMKVVTLRNLSPELVRIIRRKADEKRASVSKTVISLLEESVGIGRGRKERRAYHDLDGLSGSWPKGEAEEFDRALKAQRAIDAGLWK
jgi:hypothetical protein